jgi:hypothetical protein
MTKYRADTQEARDLLKAVLDGTDLGVPLSKAREARGKAAAPPADDKGKGPEKPKQRRGARVRRSAAKVVTATKRRKRPARTVATSAVPVEG